MSPSAGVKSAKKGAEGFHAVHLSLPWLLPELFVYRLVEGVLERHDFFMFEPLHELHLELSKLSKRCIISSMSLKLLIDS